MADVLTNKEFINFLRESVDKVVNLLNRRIEVEKEKYEPFEKNRRLFLWQRLILSIMTLLLLGISTAYKWIPTELIVPLLGGIIASLFIVPRKD